MIYIAVTKSARRQDKKQNIKNAGKIITATSLNMLKAELAFAKIPESKTDIFEGYLSHALSVKA